MALLAVVAACLARADPQAVASQADGLWAFLLRLLDVRQRLSSGQGPVPAAQVAAVEGAAVEALVALALKLSEARFRPLFLRLVDWAGSPPAATPGAPPCCAGAGGAHCHNDIMAPHSCHQLSARRALCRCMSSGSG